MLIFVWMLTILIVEGISITQIINHDSGFYDENESLLGKGLSDDEIHAVVQNKPEKVGKDDTWSICLWDFNNEYALFILVNTSRYIKYITIKESYFV